MLRSISTIGELKHTHTHTHTLSKCEQIEEEKPHSTPLAQSAHCRQAGWQVSRQTGEQEIEQVHIINLCTLYNHLAYAYADPEKD